MAKPEGWRQEADRYPVSLETQTRFQDLDLNGHLNNVAFAALFENARVHLNRSAGILAERQQGIRTMVAHVSIAYLGEGAYPAPLTICSGIGPIGSSSWTFLQAMFQDGRCIATCDSVVVARRDGAAAPLSDGFRAALAKLQLRLPD